MLCKALGLIPSTSKWEEKGSSYKELSESILTSSEDFIGLQVFSLGHSR
jgi:hypothetical protein